MDCIPDVSHKEQTSIILRHVHIDKNSSEVKILENFIGFFEALDHTGEGLANLLLNTLEKYNIDINNCRG
jgi:hypothetical protein